MTKKEKIDRLEDASAIKAKSRDEIIDIIHHYFPDPAEGYLDEVPLIAEKVYTNFTINNDLTCFDGFEGTTSVRLYDEPIGKRFWFLIDFFEPYDLYAGLPNIFGNMEYVEES